MGASGRGYVAGRIPETLFQYGIHGDGMFAKASKHDSNLRCKTRANHPGLFRASEPVVAAIIPTHTYAHYLGSAIDSVRAQTFANWECIVVDDGSDDGTVALLEKVSAVDSRIRFRSQQQRGLAATRNHGIALSRGRYLQFLDADDLLHPAKLEHQVAALETDAALDIVYGPTMYFDDQDPHRVLGGNLRRCCGLARAVFRNSGRAHRPIDRGQHHDGGCPASPDRGL